jgi:hypothetical protein
MVSDWLEDRRDLDEWRAQLLELVFRTPWLDWLMLTKRIDNWRALVCAAYDWHLQRKNLDVAE